MNGKLTLSINRDVINDARTYAKAKGLSLSSMVEGDLKSLSWTEKPNQKKEKLKVVRQLKGSVPMPKDFVSYQQILEDVLAEKYLAK